MVGSIRALSFGDGADGGTRPLGRVVRRAGLALVGRVVAVFVPLATRTGSPAAEAVAQMPDCVDPRPYGGANGCGRIIHRTELLTVGARVGQALSTRGETVGVAEGSGGGLVSAALLAVPGSSAYYAGGAVIYTLAANRAFLAGSGVDAPDGLRGAERRCSPRSSPVGCRQARRGLGHR